VLLSVKDLRVFYKKAEAVKGVSFIVDEGTLVSIIGANGAGKTTILKTLSGLLRATSGKYRSTVNASKKPRWTVLSKWALPRSRRAESSFPSYRLWRT